MISTPNCPDHDNKGRPTSAPPHAMLPPAGRTPYAALSLPLQCPLHQNTRVQLTAWEFKEGTRSGRRRAVGWHVGRPGDRERERERERERDRQDLHAYDVPTTVFVCVRRVLTISCRPRRSPASHAPSPPSPPPTTDLHEVAPSEPAACGSEARHQPIMNTCAALLPAAPTQATRTHRSLAPGYSPQSTRSIGTQPEL
eukprot:COSAG02_NODE_8368_length_2596_cov_11.117741_2_plen_198_part_00